MVRGRGNFCATRNGIWEQQGCILVRGGRNTDFRTTRKMVFGLGVSLGGKGVHVGDFYATRKVVLIGVSRMYLVRGGGT